MTDCSGGSDTCISPRVVHFGVTIGGLSRISCQEDLSALNDDGYPLMIDTSSPANYSLHTSDSDPGLCPGVTGARWPL